MRWPIGALLLGLLGCGDEEPAANGHSSSCAGNACDPHPEPASCPDELMPAADGVGCEALLPLEACPPGTMPVLGSAACAPVGFVDCPEGFAIDEGALGGRGCRAVLPPVTCTGATRDALGGDCLPVGDCDAPLPPQVGYFVDASYGPEELDDTHFTTLIDALHAAPPGSVVGLEPGDYAATVQLEPVTLVGRCAEKVTLTGDGSNVGFLVREEHDVTLRGLTMRGFAGAVVVDSGGSAAVEDCVFEGNELAGLVADDPGSRLTVSRSVVRGTLPGAQPGAGVLAEDGGRIELDEVALTGNTLSNATAFEAGSELILSRSVVRDALLQPDGDLAGTGGMGVYVYRGGHAEVRESAVRGGSTAGVLARKVSEADPTIASSLVLERSEVTTVADTMRGGVGRAVAFLDGGTGSVSSATIGDASDAALLVGAGSSATIADVTVVGAVSVAPVSGHGMFVDGGTLDVERAVVSRHRKAAFSAGNGAHLSVRDSLALDGVDGEGGPTEAGSLGAFAFAGSSLELERVSLLGAIGVAVYADGAGSSIDAAGILVSDVQPNAYGFFGRALVVQNGGRVTVGRSALLALREVGVLAADPDTSAIIADSVIGPTTSADDGSMGHGIVALDGAHLVMEGTTLSQSTAIGLVVAAAGAFIDRSWVKGNAVGMQVQDGSVLHEASTASSEPVDVVVTRDTAFVDNGSRVGSGAIPLPSLVEP